MKNNLLVKYVENWYRKDIFIDKYIKEKEHKKISV